MVTQIATVKNILTDTTTVMGIHTTLTATQGDTMSSIGLQDDILADIPIGTLKGIVTVILVDRTAGTIGMTADATIQEDKTRGGGECAGTPGRETHGSANYHPKVTARPSRSPRNLGRKLSSEEALKLQV